VENKRCWEYRNKMINKIKNSGTKEDLAVEIYNKTRTIDELKKNIEDLKKTTTELINDIISHAQFSLSSIQNLIGEAINYMYVREEFNNLNRYLDKQKERGQDDRT
jgi:predicted  nucleic acid-binding Zn-ribbon protein